MPIACRSTNILFQPAVGSSCQIMELVSDVGNEWWYYGEQSHIKIMDKMAV